MAQGIHRHPITFYEELIDLFHAPRDHWVHLNSSGLVNRVFDKPHSEELELGNQSPILGHALERMWTPMFGCFSPQPTVEGVNQDITCMVVVASAHNHSW